jgi:diguanylate cyclase
MNALPLLRSRRVVVPAIGLALLASLALAARRLDLPGFAPELESLLFGLIGVVVGCLTVAGGAGTAAAPSPAKNGAGEVDAVDRLVRSIARLIQTHLSDSDAYSERLNGATKRLSQHQQAGPVNEIVLALIEDNREMRDKLAGLRSELEEARLRALQLQNDLQRSEEAGMRDPVTLIGNRRNFDAALAEELEKAQRTGAPFCLALADLDRFKLINDRFGHLVGDSVLKLFADILAKNVRSMDRVARYGGEEFAVMLPGVGLGDAVSIADRIRTILEGKRWTIEPNHQRIGKVTVSFGVARYRPGETGTQLLKRADECLYDAKAHGRNCVVPEDAREASEPLPLQRAVNG